MQYFTLLTALGAAKIAAATAANTTVNLTHIAVGDGNGIVPMPDASKTALVKEVFRTNLNDLTVDSNNANWITTEAYISSNDGNFWIREVGIFDIDGDLIAIGNYPETFKPVMADGVAKDLYIKVIIEVSSSSAVTLQIDPSILMASQEYVNEKLNQKAQKVHNHDEKANISYVDLKPSGFKNFIINGTFDIWEKGLSFPITNQYTANRTHSLLGSVQAVESELNRTYDYQITLSNGSSGNSIYSQAILREDIQHLQNKKVTFSMKRQGAIGNFQVYLVWRDSLKSSTNQTNVQSFTFPKTNTDWEKFEGTVTLSEANPTNKYLVVIISAGADFNSTCRLNELQLEEGAKATNFENRPLWLEKELCSYFYEKRSLNMLVGQTNDSTGVRGLIEYKNKRIEPSIMAENLGAFNDNNVSYGVSSVSFSSVEKDKSRYDAMVVSNGFLNKYPVYGNFDIIVDAEVY